VTHGQAANEAGAVPMAAQAREGPDTGVLLGLVNPGATDEKLLTELGRAIAAAGVLEVTIAVLVALTEGKRGQAVDNRVLEIVKSAGEARRQLAPLGTSRPLIRWLCNDTQQLLGARNFLVHALVTGRGHEAGEYVQAIYSAREDTEEYITAATVADHARYFEENAERFREAIAAELAGQLTGVKPGYPPRPSHERRHA
jgi:hypothetical protein